MHLLDPPCIVERELCTGLGDSQKAKKSGVWQGQQNQNAYDKELINAYDRRVLFCQIGLLVKCTLTHEGNPLRLPENLLG